jgi:hypothetical protein
MKFSFVKFGYGKFSHDAPKKSSTCTTELPARSLIKFHFFHSHTHSDTRRTMGEIAQKSVHASDQYVDTQSSERVRYRCAEFRSR